MKILAVIVGEMPDKCADCKLNQYDVFGKKRFCPAHEDWAYVDGGLEFPEWCPLKTAAQYEREVGRE